MKSFKEMMINEGKLGQLGHVLGRFIDKATGSQSRRLNTKVAGQMDDRQVKLLGHLTKDNKGGSVQDHIKLASDPRYKTMNKRYMATHPTYGDRYRSGHPVKGLKT